MSQNSDRKTRDRADISDIDHPGGAHLGEKGREKCDQRVEARREIKCIIMQSAMAIIIFGRAVSSKRY